MTRIAWIGPLPPATQSWPWPIVPFSDGDAFLLSAAPFGLDAYVVVAAQPGLATVELLTVIRSRSEAPVLLLDGPGLPGLLAALQAGADMVLPEDASHELLQVALQVVARRGAAGSPPMHWVVSDVEQVLISPRLARVPLSDTEHRVMLAFAEAQGQPVSRATLAAQIWGTGAPASDNTLHAAIYRLRRRIEQECGDAPPIRSLQRLGYAFDAPLRRGR